MRTNITALEAQMYADISVAIALLESLSEDLKDFAEGKNDIRRVIERLGGTRDVVSEEFWSGE